MKHVPCRMFRALLTLVITIAALLGTTNALGQQGGTLLPPSLDGANQPAPQRVEDVSAAPQPRLPKEYPVWVGYLVIFLMVAAIMGASLMPSKRSHQD